MSLRAIPAARAAGPNIIHAVDGAGRVQSVRYEDRFHVRPDRVARYAYDTLGRVSRVDDFSGRTDLTYDAAGRIATDTRTQDGRAYVTDYDYDGLGNLVELTYPSGMRVRFEREAADPAKLSRVVAVDGAVETVLADEITYTAAGLPTGYTAGNGLRYGFERGAGGRLERLTTGLPGDPTPDVLDLTYQYDATGNITAILDAVDPERTAYYRHDPLDRLVEADGWWGTLGWTYDRTGNRLSEARDGVTSTYAYQAGTSRLLAVTDAATGATEHALEYDASGQATRFDDLLLEYDAADRLFRVRDAATGATVQENGYDHAFRRTRRTSYRDAAGVPLPAPACTAFVCDATSRLIAEHDCSAGSPPAPAGNVTAEYVYLEGYAVLAVRRGGAWYGYASDHLATPRKATDATGAVVWDGRMEPFGKVDEAVASIDQPLRFPGQHEDGGLGLTYNHHRWFVPGLGRLGSSEPLLADARLASSACGIPNDVAAVVLDESRRLHPYSYASGDPLSLFEFGGLMPIAYPSPVYPSADVLHRGWGWIGAYLTCMFLSPEGVISFSSMSLFRTCRYYCPQWGADVRARGVGFLCTWLCANVILPFSVQSARCRDRISRDWSCE
jgi:RHS repeat-associated protein